MFSLFLGSYSSAVILVCVEAGVVFFVRCLLFLESTLGTLCTDDLYKCADGLIKL